MSYETDLIKRSSFIRKIEAGDNQEFKHSYLDAFFTFILEGRNKNCLYEIFSFELNFNANIFKYGRVVSEDVIKSAVYYRNRYNGEMKLVSRNNFCFDDSYYSYTVLNFDMLPYSPKLGYSPLFIERTSKSDGKVRIFNYNILM